MNIQEQAITIQQVSQELDIPKPTLRFWEREFVGILGPLRTNGGQRRYAPKHISVIKKIKMLKKDGLSLIQIKRKLGKGIDDSMIGGLDDWGKGRYEGQTSGAGSQLSGDGRTDGIDLLAERVAEVVKMEVLRFFESGH